MAAKEEFKPGFRISLIDIAVLVVGTVGTIALWSQVWPLAPLIAFAVGHFFLFCNVFRIARPPELIWATVFLALAGATIALQTPSWTITILISLFLTLLVILLEMRKPSYHGIGWQRINPDLRKWWDSKSDVPCET